MVIYPGEWSRPDRRQGMVVAPAVVVGQCWDHAHHSLPLVDSFNLGHTDLGSRLSFTRNSDKKQDAKDNLEWCGAVCATRASLSTRDTPVTF